MRPLTLLVLAVVGGCGDAAGGKDPECAPSFRFDAWNDADGDGAGDPDTRATVCDLADGQVTNADDCDDGDAAVSPFEAELCDGLDQDCDGVPDDGLVGGTWFADSDRDGFGDPAAPVQGCMQPDGTSKDDTDCDDAHDDAFPGAPEVCDGYDNNCDTLVDDLDPAVDATTGPTFYFDADHDGFGDDLRTQQHCANPNPGTLVDAGGDCDDALAAVNPDADEICDTLDNDCDLLIDEADPSIDPAELSTFYEDLDQDGAGNDLVTTQSCFAGNGAAVVGGDCNDGDPNIQTADTWLADGDSDGVGAGPVLGAPSCLPPQAGAVPEAAGLDCDDADPARFPGNNEVCADGIDQDCSGSDASCGPVGSFRVHDGPDWGTDPPVVSCIEACAQLFGGLSSDWHCSTSAAVVNNQAYLSGYADAFYCTNPAAEDFKREPGGNPGYDCGAFGCAYSAYVRDNCGAVPAENYCWEN